MLLDNITVSVACPLCEFDNPFTIKQARLRDVIICRGCKANVQLDDQMNECRKVVRQVERAINDLQDSFRTLNFRITL